MSAFIRLSVLVATRLACCASALVMSSAHAQGAFDQAYKLQGVSFRVSSANQGSLNTLRIEPSGRLKNPQVIEQEIEGTVVGAEVADLDRNGWPEIYVYVQSAGSGSYGTVVGHAVNRGLSITPIFLPELTEDKKASAGYMGRDRFSIANGRLVRRFPLYRPGDANAAPSGGTRELHYRLVHGEASWMLKLDSGRTRDRPQ